MPLLYSLALLIAPFLAHADAPPAYDDHVQAALRLLPPSARTGARVEKRGEQGMELYRDGDNGWTCWVEIVNGDRLAANCHHTVLDGFILRGRALHEEGLHGAEQRERLGEDLRAGRIAVPAGSMEITGSGPLRPDGAAPNTLEGWYFLYFPFATAETLGIPDEDPGQGRPWLHHAGTAKAHIMWPSVVVTDTPH